MRNPLGQKLIRLDDLLHTYQICLEQIAHIRASAKAENKNLSGHEKAAVNRLLFIETKIRREASDIESELNPSPLYRVRLGNRKGLVKVVLLTGTESDIRTYLNYISNMYGNKPEAFTILLDIAEVKTEYLLTDDSKYITIRL